MRRLLLGFTVFVAICHSMSSMDISVERQRYMCRIREDGTIASLVCRGAEVPFFDCGRRAGPSFYVRVDSSEVHGIWKHEENGVFVCRIGDVSASLQYCFPEDCMSFSIALRNEGDSVFAPDKAGISLGVDTYMDDYPDWLSKYFPTLLMCESTHFYGYMQSPEGNLLGIVSTEPVASWNLDYNRSYYDIPEYWFYGHRIQSVNIDLINCLPLPEHHPQNLWCLEPGEEKVWKFSLIPVSSLSSFEEDMVSVTGVPMIGMEQTSYSVGERACFSVFIKDGGRPSVRIVHEDGCFVKAGLRRLSMNDDVAEWRVEAELGRPGQYNVEIDISGRRLTAVILVRDSWENIMRNARKAALHNCQKPSSHVESWYGFYSAFLAARHFPDEMLDAMLDERFDLICSKTFDREKGIPKIYEGRIQNTAATIGMLVDRYQAYGRIEDLELASRLADWLIEHHQCPDGAYMNGDVRYTSVIYIAKSIMELYVAERECGESDRRWSDCAARHYDSVRKAVDELVASDGDFETEGEMTFEDGMISCSALQIGMFALLQEDSQLKAHYRDAMLKLLDTHDCLTQLKIADGRRRGGTLRFWEAQYDVLMLPDMISSPHGWSAWRAYADYYAYLLTMDERYLLEMFNAAGAFANLIDYKTGKLRWAFVVDPYLEVRQIAAPVEGVSFDDVTTGNPHPDFYGSKSFIIGEQYVDMISSWQPVNSQDNDVHEIFKFMEEAVLTTAYVVERRDGSLAGYNCRVERRGGRLIVTPLEKQISELHLNLKSEYEIDFRRL